jgi:hypothetical protein
MENNWIRRWRIFVDITKIVIIALVISSFIVGNLYALATFNFMLAEMERKIAIHELQHRLDIQDVLELLKQGLTISYENDQNQLILSKYIVDTMKMITNNTENLQKTQNQIKDKLDSYQIVDTTLSETLREANVQIGNITQGCGGSGTHIKLQGESYILTCAHLVNSIDDMVIALLDNGDMCPLRLVKINTKKDLALFKIYNTDSFASIEIGTESPQPGNQVIAVGNPDNMVDAITNGVIATILPEGYIFTNLIYFGNSGGALIYKDKLVGVVSQIRMYNEFFGVVVNYGFAVKLEDIKEFLGDTKCEIQSSSLSL